MTRTIKRFERRKKPCLLPEPIPGEPGLFQAIFFCNGPQCGQSPAAIHALLAAGFPADKILYYRGGLHDWLTLGLPVVAGE